MHPAHVDEAREARRQDWFDVACCPTNIARTLASLGRYVYASDETALYIHQFISSRANAEIGGKPVSVEMQSDIAHGGKVTIKTTGAASLPRPHSFLGPIKPNTASTERASRRVSKKITPVSTLWETLKYRSTSM